MSQSSGIPLEELRPHMFLLRDRDATSHLMRSGLCCCAFVAKGVRKETTSLVLQMEAGIRMISWDQHMPGVWQLGKADVWKVVCAEICWL